MKYLAYVFALLMLFGCSTAKEAADAPSAEQTAEMKAEAEAKVEAEMKATEDAAAAMEAEKKAQAKAEWKAKVDALSPDRQKLVGWMQQNEKAFAKAISGLTAEQWSYRESEERWSIGEVAEHIVYGESSMVDSISEALAAEAKPEMKSDTVDAADKMIVGMMRDRTQTFNAPDPAQPTGKYASAEEAIADFHAARKKTMKALFSDADLRAHFATHPAFGDLDVQSWMAFGMSHCERHLKQIAQVKADAGYPAG